MSSPDDDDRNLFAGVRFVLLGFDSVSESQVPPPPPPPLANPRPPFLDTR
jgi:hypothetical protein